MSVNKIAYIINPDSGRSLKVGSKTYRRLVKEGKIKNEEFHKLPDNELVRVVNAKKPREINSLLKDDYITKKSEEIIDTILKKYEKTLLNISSNKLESKINELINKEYQNEDNEQESEFEKESQDEESNDEESQDNESQDNESQDEDSEYEI